MSRHGKLAAGSERIAAIIDAETAEALRELAKADRRSVSNFVAAELARVVAARRAKDNPDRRRSWGGEADPVSRPDVA